jgi:hypothetical protein
MFQYAPKRIVSMMKGGYLTRSLVKAAALFCYYEHNNWILFSTVQTNFPKGYKVQSSTKKPAMRQGMSASKPKQWDYDNLHWILIEQVSFQELALRRLANITAKGSLRVPRKTKGLSARTAHRRGKELFRQSLMKFAFHALLRFELTDLANHS